MPTTIKKKNFKSYPRIFENKRFKRIRYTTSHPIDFTQDLIEAHKEIE